MRHLPSSSDSNRLRAASTGIQNSLVISRTEVGQRGSAGRWPSGRGIRGLITHSPPLGDPRHTALLSLLNVTLVDWAGQQFRALEACAKCKTFQVGGTWGQWHNNCLMWPATGCCMYHVAAETHGVWSAPSLTCTQSLPAWRYGSSTAGHD
jgi:hypothetical protein